MAAPSLQDGIERAGSPVALLWKPGAAPWLPEVIERPADQGHPGLRPGGRARGHRGSGLPAHLRPAPGGSGLRAGRPDLPDRDHRTGRDDPVADADRQAVRRAGAPR